MKICITGAPSTGKTAFSRALAGEMGRQGLSCELVPEYASLYIQRVGIPQDPWEQLLIAFGQQQLEQYSTRPHTIIETGIFSAIIYAEYLLPKKIPASDQTKVQQLFDILRMVARKSTREYDLVLVMNRVFAPKSDGVRLDKHLSQETCEKINADIKHYLHSEGINFQEIDPQQADVVEQVLASMRLKVS